MSRADAPRRRPVLDPVERLSEILFGLIMAMTFTGSISAGTDGHETIKEMLVGALGCNLAWGLIDAVMYLMTVLTERGRALVLARGVTGAASAREADGLIADALPPVVADLMHEDGYAQLREQFRSLDIPARPSITFGDLKGAAGVFLLVVLTTFPLVIPFLLMSEPVQALRWSHSIAIATLFVIGYLMGRHAGLRGWLTGLAMVLVGLALVLVTIALGG